MELRNIATFLRVAELGSYTKAAESLGYVQSTITAQIRQLEEEMGVKLFNQIGRKMCLSTEGKQLVVLGQEMLNMESKIMDIGNAHARELDGIVRFGSVESILYSYVLPVVEKYRSLYPKASVMLYPAVSRRLLDRLRQDEIDMAFSMGAGPYSVYCRKLCSHKEENVFIASSRHPLAARDEITFEEVLQYPIIQTGTNTLIQEELYRRAAQQGLEVRSFLQSESSSIALSLVSRNLGISLLPAYLLHSSLFEDQNMKALPVVDFSMPFEVGVYVHKNKWVTPEMSAIVNLVQSYWDMLDSQHS